MKDFFRRRKLIKIIEQIAPADSKWTGNIGVLHIKESGYNLAYVQWRDLPLWVLEYCAKACVLSSEGLLIKYPNGNI
jgi:hypothetical protein